MMRTLFLALLAGVAAFELPYKKSFGTPGKGPGITLRTYDKMSSVTLWLGRAMLVDCAVDDVRRLQKCVTIDGAVARGAVDERCLAAFEAACPDGDAEYRVLVPFVALSGATVERGADLCELAVSGAFADKSSSTAPPSGGGGGGGPLGALLGGLLGGKRES